MIDLVAASTNAFIATYGENYTGEQNDEEKNNQRKKLINKELYDYLRSISESEFNDLWTEIKIDIVENVYIIKMKTMAHL